MTSVVRSVFGAALFLAGTSAAMAQSANPPAAAPAGASTLTVAANNAAGAGGASTAAAAPAAAEVQKPRSTFVDNTDPNGGQDPNSTAGMRAFFTPTY